MIWSKIHDSWLERLVKEGGDKKVSVILQIEGVSPKVTVKTRYSQGHRFLDKEIVESSKNYTIIKSNLEHNLSEIGIKRYRALDSIKSFILDEATIDQVKRIAGFPEVSQIRLNKEHHL